RARPAGGAHRDRVPRRDVIGPPDRADAGVELVARARLERRELEQDAARDPELEARARALREGSFEVHPAPVRPHAAEAALPELVAERALGALRRGGEEPGSGRAVLAGWVLPASHAAAYRGRSPVTTAGGAPPPRGAPRSRAGPRGRGPAR